MKPVCNECGGSHEPSGARSNCISYWKLRALKSENKALVEKLYKVHDKCAQCNGSGAVDSGASDPQGNFYMEMCPQCHGTGRESYMLLDWAVSLLCSATCNPKFGDDSQQVEWAKGFGKWFAETQDLLSKSRSGLEKTTP